MPNRCLNEVLALTNYLAEPLVMKSVSIFYIIKSPINLPSYSET